MPAKEIYINPKGKINKDFDLRAVPEGDIIDALNCRWGVRNKGNVVACENILGTKEIPFILPAGVNTVIGGCEDFERDSYIAIYHNSNNKHCILRINTFSESIDPIAYEESIFNFSLDYPIINAKVLSTGKIGEGILIFTDGFNSPRYINIERMRKYTFETKNQGIGFWRIEIDFTIT